jgi:hypothetical protein
MSFASKKQMSFIPLPFGSFKVYLPNDGDAALLN